MKLDARFGLPVFLVLAMLLVSCGTGGTDVRGADQDENAGHASHQTQGNEHVRKDEPGDTPGMKGMDHGSGNMASGMLMKDGKYSDERFIDAMVPHHVGAVEMAHVAIKHAEHPEIQNLAERIISSQEAEIDELESIKKEEYGTSKVPSQTSTGQMKGMGMMNPRSLVDEKPFDRAFIDNMIPHHRSAIEMARVASDETDNTKIKELATGIISAQRGEISQMKQWRERWYRDG